MKNVALQILGYSARSAAKKKRADLWRNTKLTRDYPPSIVRRTIMASSITVDTNDPASSAVNEHSSLVQSEWYILGSA